MKRLLLVAMILLLAVGVMNAGERMTKQGTWSLNFTINGLGDFGVIGVPVSDISYVTSPTGPIQSLTLYGVGGSYFLNDDMALRANLAFNSSNVTNEVTGNEQDVTAQGWGITPALLMYMGGDGPVAAYWGPQVGYGMFTITDENPPAGPEGKLTGTTFSVALVMGAQWWAWDQVAFNAEYGLGYVSSSSELEGGGTTVDGPSTTDFGITSWSVGLGVFFNR